MAPDPISNYQTAIQNREAAQRKVEGYIQVIRDAASKLQNWQEVSIANSGVGFPSGAMRTSINADHWPSAQQLAEALGDWHAARHEADNAYRQIPENQRAVVQSPEN